MSNPILEAINICKVYTEGQFKTAVLSKVNFTVKAGELTAITGPSGCGKSTLLQILGGLDEPSSGKVMLNSKPFSGESTNKRAALRNKHVGFVYQFHHLLPEFSAVQNVAMPLLIAGEPVSQATEKARDMLKKVKLSHRLSHKPSELSGGERQRVAIARALVTKPDIVLADEPTGNLDSDTASEVFDLILDLNIKEKTAFVIVTHDEKLAKKCAKNLVI